MTRDAIDNSLPPPTQLSQAAMQLHPAELPPKELPSGSSGFSIFAKAGQAPVDVPMRVLNRPLPSELDEDKVQRFMRDIQVRLSYSTPFPAAADRTQAGDDFTPIEVLRCELPDGRRYYFSFGGCHRCVRGSCGLGNWS